MIHPLKSKCQYLAILTPPRYCRGFQAWQEANCKQMGDIFDSEGLMPFDRIWQAYGLPETEHRRSIHIRNWVSHPSIKPHCSPAFSTGCFQNLTINVYYPNCTKCWLGLPICQISSTTPLGIGVGAPPDRMGRNIVEYESRRPVQRLWKQCSKWLTIGIKPQCS